MSEMSTAAFFDGLTLEMIESFVAREQEENLSLEFKTVAGSELVSGSDKRNLAEASSGFANSAGGIVIWGISTARISGVDAAKATAAISDVRAFLARLNEFTPLYVTPSIEGVVHRAFPLPDGTGFAATFVPESSVGPHMALNGLDRYYRRGPVGFYAMKHFEIADMFGRRQRSVLRMELTQPVLSHGGGNGPHAVRLYASIVNDGRASAAAPFIHLQAEPHRVSVKPSGLSSPDAQAMLRLVTETSEHPSYAIVGTSDFAIHPKMRVQVIEFNLEVRDNEDVPQFVISYVAAARDTPPTEGELIIEPIRIAAALVRNVAAISKRF